MQPIAIVGLGSILPEAPDTGAFWRNVTAGRYSISEVAPDRWDPGLYYDPDPAAPDKTYSKIGGWVRDWEWDPFAWHLPIPPKVAEQMDDAQKWAVACTHMALEDHGRELDRERCGVILGNALAGEKHYLTALRVTFPEIARELAAVGSFAALPTAVQADVRRELGERFAAWLPPVTEDTMPGELSNCVAGRIANLFNLRGPNFVVDAACASALAALDAAVEELSEGRVDSCLAGGIDRNMGASSFIKFCAIGALSATGTRPYADGADGFVMGEGAAVFLLKRLADAERDGDRIYAVVRGVAGASDGKGKGITAPNPIGQRLAVSRAWERAGLSPAACSLVEGHGTSTRVGDVVEVSALGEAFAGAGLEPGSVALGSVKSNIGHLKAAAGAAGLLKATLALHHKQLPPSLGFAAPNPNVEWSRTPFRVNTELADWPNGRQRVAGVSAFGFGGTNFHAVLEEHIPGRFRERTAVSVPVDVPADTPAPPATEVKAPPRGALVLGADDEAALVARLREVLASGRAPAPAAPAPEVLAAPERLAIDFADAADLRAKGEQALKAFSAPAMWPPLRARGIFRGSGPAPRLAFLFTGQGSQYANMLRDLRHAEPVVAEVFDRADAVMRPLLAGRALSDVIFVDPEDADAVAAASAELMRTEITQPAVLAVDLALQRLLETYGITPDLVMGHSLGEYGALVAAGALTFEAALEAVSARGREMASLHTEDNGAMAAVGAPAEEVEAVLREAGGYAVVANVNSTRQVVIGGATAPIERAVELLTARGRQAVRIPVSHAFHTAIVAPAAEPLKATLRRLDIGAPRVPLVANVDGGFYPDTPDEVIELLGRQVASPVQFVKGLRTLHGAGARTFVEIGPKRALASFAADVLGDDVVCLFTNHPKLGDLMSFNHALCGLWAAGHGAGVAFAPDHATAASSPAPAPVLAEPVVITGASLGLPGGERVFDDAAVRRILDGEQLIDVIPAELRRRIVDKHITRLVKGDDGSGSFEAIDDVAEVIKLAARAGELDLAEEFGVDPRLIPALGHDTRMAIAAGLDALRDAGLPLVMRHRTTSKGTTLPDGWGLPEELRDDTGVIFASAFPGLEEFAAELDGYWTDRGRREQRAALEAIRARLTEADGAGSAALAEVDRRIHDLSAALEREPYAFDRRFLFRILSMGHSQLAQLIGARGPNTQLNAACASTTQAIALAEDWIRAGRCRRVVVVAADDATSDRLLPWIGGGFLASGAAATDETVEEAALPFDERRHGMLLGMGAAGIVVESAEAARERGLTPICEVLAAVTANSAFHGTRLDVSHISAVMESLVAQAEARGVPRRDMAREMLFVSHETYTPARGGSAAAEVHALRDVFREDADAIVVANTKGYTGHPMGVGIEDVVAVKALETGRVPAVPNFRVPDEELGELNLSKGGAYPIRYALRLAAGFGSQISLALLRWTPVPDGRHRHPDELGYEYRVTDRPAWDAWLARVSGKTAPVVEVVQRRLRVAEEEPVPAPEPAAVPEPVVASEPEPAAVAAPAPAVTREPVAVAAPVAAPEPVAVAAPDAAPEPVAEPAPEAAPAGAVLESILAVVAEQTGYPTDLLDPELDLEADLGIDTVKQAEVFAAIRERYGIERDDTLKLRDYPTLNHVAAFVRDRTTTPEPAPAPAPVAEPAPRFEPVPDTPGFPRRVPVPVVRPALERCAPTGVTLGAGTRVYVEPDRGGVATALAEALHVRGAELVDDPRLAAVVFWLPALDVEPPLAEMTPEGWHHGLDVRVKQLAITMRDAPPQTALVAATRLGGRHGYDAAGATSAMGGAVTGFTKALAREREQALVKAVDFAPEAEVGPIAGALIGELERDPGIVELGHADGLRWGIGMVQRPAVPEPGRALRPTDTFVVTGAAGSIVSAIVADLAAGAGGGTFHLLDLAPAPRPDDPDLARFATDRDGLKRDLIERLRAGGEKPTPKLVERELAAIERKAAAMDAIRAIERAGGTADWQQLDLTDPGEVAAAVGDLGRVDVLVHAAGLDISHALTDKPQDEYDLVFDVKADGWFHVLHALRGTPIGAAVVFSSIAGRFGNAGQTDYAAANDLLCKSVSRMRREGATRGIAVDWTAWAGIGMASRGSIPKVMELAGIEMLPAEAGVPVVRRELTAAGDGGEVVVAGRLGVLLEERHATGGVEPYELGGPVSGRVERISLADGVSVVTTLDPAAQGFLDDHRIDGTPVLPGVMGVEAFAEAAKALAPASQVTAVEDVDLLAPFKFYRDEPRTFETRAVLRDAGDGTLVADCRLIGRRTLPQGETETVHFTGRVRLAPKAPAAPHASAPEAPTGETVGHDDLYRVYFHGPAYQVLARAYRANGDVVGELADGLPPNHDHGDTETTPRLIELCFQTAGAYELGTAGRMALPTHVDRVTRFAGADRPGRLAAVVSPRAGGVDAEVVDEQGEVRVRLEGYRTTELPGGIDAAALAPIRKAMS